METTAQKLYRQGLSRLSPIDGRETIFTKGLSPFLSEGALHRYRGVVEIEALIALSDSAFPHRPNLAEVEKKMLRSLVTSEAFDAMAVAEYDHFGRNGVGPLEHDIKAVEMYLRERCDQAGLGKFKEWIHFPMTSEDVNNLAWNLMLRDAITGNALGLTTVLVNPNSLDPYGARPTYHVAGIVQLMRLFSRLK